MASKPSVGGLIDSIWELREEKRDIEKKAEAVSAKISELEEQLMATLEEQGLDKATGKTATASISTSVVANVVDWEKLYKYVKKTGYFHLFQRRVSDTACRELFENHTKKQLEATGLEPFVKKRINVRTLSS